MLPLNEGQGQRYDELHHSMDTHLLGTINDAGLRNYTLFRNGDLVIGYVEAEEDFLGCLARAEASDTHAAWAAEFAGVFAERNPSGGGSGIKVIAEIWHLD